MHMTWWRLIVNRPCRQANRVIILWLFVVFGAPQVVGLSLSRRECSFLL